MLHLGRKRSVLIVISFIILSIFSAILIIIHGQMYITNDSLFHSGRLLELIKSSRLFPEYTFNSFNFDGSSVMTMYPYLFLYPIVILYYFSKSIKSALLLSFILWTLLSLFISYWSSFSYTHRWLSSYIFSVIYALSGEATAMYLYSPYSDLGVYFSYLFLPLVIFGFISFLKQGRWIMLSVGMSMIMYSNVISVAFITGLLFIWILCDYRQMTLLKFNAIIKAILLMLITTAAVWIPMLKLMLHNQLRVPSTKAIVPVSLIDLLSHALRNNFTISCQYLTIFSLLGLLMGVLGFRRLSGLTKQLYIFAVFVILISSDLFPWRIFSQNYLIFKWVRSIQVTVRMMVIPQLILEFILAVVVANYINRHPVDVKRTVMVALFIALGLAQFKAQSEIICQRDGIDNFAQVQRPVIRSHVMDYWPQVSVNNQQRPLIYHSRAVDDDNGRTMMTYHLGHGYYHFNNQTYIHNLSLPVFYYYDVPYRVRLDGQNVTSHSAHRQLMTLRHIKPGKHRVHIEVPLALSTVVARGLTIMSIFIYAGLLIVRIRRKEK